MNESSTLTRNLPYGHKQGLASVKQLLYSTLLLLLCSLLLHQNLYSQSGVEFWFVAPQVTAGHNDRPIALRISSYSDPATVTVSQPANAGFTAKVVNVAANSTVSVDLTNDIATIENSPANTVLNYGVLITATAEIACYYEVVTNNNTDIFALKAKNALGKEFIVPGQSFWKSGNYTPMPVNAIDIVATTDNTLLTITPSKAAVGHAAGVAFTVSLNRGQTYSLQASNSNATDKLGGTLVSSDKDVAITISDDSGYNSSYGGCKDLMGDQMIPINKIGKEYIVLKGFLGSNGNKDDKVYILATQDNTNIMLDASGTTFTLNKGDQYEISLSNPTVYIEADKDIYVMHVTGFGCEIGAAILPSVYCTGSTQVSFTRSKDESFYMIVLVPDQGEGYFKINGLSNLLTAADFTNVPGTNGNWKAARKYFSKNDLPKNQAYVVTNSEGKFHLGIINGGSNTGCMYGYFTDFGKVDTDPIYHY